MRLTLTSIAILVSLSATTRAELVPSQSLTTPFDVPTLASSALNRDSKTVTANSLAMITASNTLAPQPANSDSVSLITTAANAAASDDQDSNLSVLDRLSSVASDTVRKFKQTGIASWYGHQFNGRKTATGERFDMNAMTAAHRSLPLSCFIRVTNKDNGKSVIVKVNDRGPYAGNRILDLSYAAAEQLGIVNKGMGNVTIERIASPN